jgi:hypothetical protein
VLIPACVPGVHATCASRVGLGYIDIYGLESDLRHALRKGLESKKNRGRAKRGPKILVYIYIYRERERERCIFIISYDFL